MYRFFVREDLDDALRAELGRRLAESGYDIGRFLAMLFASRDFYAPESMGTRIKSPVELLVSTYRRLGQKEIPGIPDFNVVSGALGQRLFHPPTVAGWAEGRAWITPSLLQARGNFVLDVAFPDITFVAPDRYPTLTPNIVAVHQRLRDGASISAATRPPGVDGGEMAAANALADRDEAFNTRYGSYRGWQMAIERVEPIPRSTARLRLAQSVLDADLETPEAVVAYFEQRFFSVPLDDGTRARLADFLADQLGTRDIVAARSFLEEPLRVLLHLMLSLPEYQLG